MRRIWTSALVITAALGGAKAAAQDAAPRAEGLSTNAEVVVTVQKRAQNLRDVPINVTAFGGNFLDAIGVEKFDELAAFVPGLEIQEQSPNNPGFVIRGITSDSGESNVEPRVAVFQDGVSISRSRGSYVELFDLERVEVAKGPQATLFGRGALIGGINLIQNKANTEAQTSSFEVKAGSLETLGLRGVVNVPVVEGVFGVRLAGAFRERTGTNTNVADGGSLGAVEAQAFRAAARYTPNDRFTLDVIGNIQTDDNSGTSFKSGTFAPPAGNTSPFSFAALNAFGPYPPLGLTRDVESVTALASYKLSDGVTLNSITGYRFFDSVESFDPDGSSLRLFQFVEDAKGLQYSQELRLNFEGGGRLSGFVGASYVREDGRQSVPLAFDERVTLGLLTGQITRPAPQSEALLTNPAFTAPLLGGFAAASLPAALQLSSTELALLPAIARNLKAVHTEGFSNEAVTDTIDLFGDVTFKATEKLELTAGVRWTQDDKTVGQSATVSNGRSILGGFIGALSQAPATRAQLLGALAAPGAASIPTSAAFPVPNFGLFAQPITGVATASGTFDDFTWRLVGRYALSEDISAYASYARGRRPEVLTTSGAAAPNGPVTFRTLPAETVDSFEVGAKARTLGGALNLDGSVFYYNYNDFQTTEFQGARIVTVNAGEATSYGFEGQATWAPFSNLEVFGTYAYNHSRFETGARNGNSFRLSPDHSFSVGALISRQLLGGEFTFIPTYTWQSEIFFDDDNDKPNLQTGRLSPAFNDTRIDEKQGSYGLLNLRAEYKPAGSPASLGLFVTNALDEEYIIDAGNTGDSFGIPTFIRGVPRIAGVEVKASF